MSATTMLVISLGVLLAPFVLMVVFNRTDEADARGRRLSRRWKT